MLDDRQGAGRIFGGDLEYHLHASERYPSAFKPAHHSPFLHRDFLSASCGKSILHDGHSSTR
jgi:hypothetical protein